MSSTVDLFLTNRPSLVNRCEPLPGLGDHEIVYIDTDISAKLNKPVKRKIYIWKKANKDKLEDQASEMVKQFKDSLAEMSVSMYTISWSPNPGSGSHLLTRDGLFVRNMSSVFSCLVSSLLKYHF
jgi:hypothetical protein